jgi:pyrimidine-nucleoside phosphorylase
MDQPLGGAVGNALEIRETVATLRGAGPPDLGELTLAACGHLLSLSDLGIDEQEGRRRAEAAVRDGSALERYERWIRAQGGDPAEDALPVAPVRRAVEAPTPGVVERLGAVAIGTAALRLGAGRSLKEDAIDHAVGVRCLKKRGDRVERGEPLAEVHARTEAAAERAAHDVLAAYVVGSKPLERTPVVLATLG